jgi:hypothetical protein
MRTTLRGAPDVQEVNECGGLYLVANSFREQDFSGLVTQYVYDAARQRITAIAPDGAHICRSVITRLWISSAIAAAAKQFVKAGAAFFWRKLGTKLVY